MASKKGKKNKGKTLALVDFLQETPGAVSVVPVRKATLNWADEVEDNHDAFDARSSKASVVLPTAPKASRDFDDIIDKVPQEPPYIAYLSNLPYDVDDSEISFFFKNMKISNMRIPKDDRPGDVPKLKGFGYVEFEDRESLLSALVMSDTTMKNRRIRIEVASEFDDKRRSNRMDMNRDRNRSDISMGDWRSGPRTESSNVERRGFGRERERDGGDDNGTWRDGDRRSNRDSERNFTRSSDRYRDDRDSDFSRPRGDRDSDFSRPRGDRDSEFSRSRSDRDSEFSRSRGGDRDEKSSFMSRRYDNDKGRSTGFSRNPGREDTDTNKSTEPRVRPKLVLAPRTKPVEAAPAATSASIFGNAKPVDTSARERQIEERLAKETDAPPQRELSGDRREVSRERRDLSRDEGNHDRRELSRERKEGETPTFKEKMERAREDRSVERPHIQKADANGVVDKTHSVKKNGEHEKKEVVKGEANDKQKTETKKREEKKEKEMPKLKKVDPPNFIANNKFATLENEDNSD